MKSLPKHILIIRLSAMGDVAMTAPLIFQLSKRYHDTKITLLTHSFFSPIFQDIPNVSIHPVDLNKKHKGILGLFRLSKELKKENIEVVADLHNVLRSSIICLFLKLMGIKSFKLNKGRSEKKALTRQKNKVFKQLKHTVQRYIDVFSDIGYKLSFEHLPTLNKKQLHTDFLELKNNSKKLIGVAPFAAYKNKTYDINLMKSVIEILSKAEKNHILLFGGKEERHLLNLLKNNLLNVSIVTKKYTFKEELSIISNLDLMISMDSGNGHLAAAYGVSNVVIWGATHPYAGFSPIGKSTHLIPNIKKYPLIPTSVFGNKTPENYLDVISTIQPTEIVNAVNDILNV